LEIQKHERLVLERHALWRVGSSWGRENNEDAGELSRHHSQRGVGKKGTGFAPQMKEGGPMRPGKKVGERCTDQPRKRGGGRERPHQGKVAVFSGLLSG